MRFATAASLTLALVAAASANAAVFVGSSDPHNVPIHLFTSQAGKPVSLHYGHYKVPCSRGYRLGYRVTGAVPPFTQVEPGNLLDRYHHHKPNGSDVTIVSRAHQHLDRWKGRFHALWIFKKDGDPYTRCEFAFRFSLEPKSG